MLCQMQDRRDDGAARPRPAPGTGANIREVATAETMQALADPLRLGILRVLMSGHRQVMTVKELAAELSSPPTRLYRHVKQLLAAGLIEVAETRLVSGIVESRYRACQDELTLGPGLLDRSSRSEVAGAVSAVFAGYRTRLLAALADSSDDNVPFVASIGTRLSAERAEEFRVRLKALVTEYDEGDDAAGAVQVDLLIGLAVTERGRGPGRAAGQGRIAAGRA